MPLWRGEANKTKAFLSLSINFIHLIHVNPYNTIIFHCQYVWLITSDTVHSVNHYIHFIELKYRSKIIASKIKRYENLIREVTADNYS